MFLFKKIHFQNSKKCFHNKTLTFCESYIMSHTLWVVQFWVKLLVGSWCKGNPIGNFFRIIRKEELKVSWRKEPLSPTPKPDTALNSKFYFCTISYLVHTSTPPPRTRSDLDELRLPREVQTDKLYRARHDDFRGVPAVALLSRHGRKSRSAQTGASTRLTVRRHSYI